MASRTVDGIPISLARTSQTKNGLPTADPRRRPLRLARTSPRAETPQRATTARGKTHDSGLFASSPMTRPADAAARVLLHGRLRARARRRGQSPPEQAKHVERRLVGPVQVLRTERVVVVESSCRSAMATWLGVARPSRTRARSPVVDRASSTIGPEGSRREQRLARAVAASGHRGRTRVQKRSTRAVLPIPASPRIRTR